MGRLGVLLSTDARRRELVRDLLAKHMRCHEVRLAGSGDELGLDVLPGSFEKRPILRIVAVTGGAAAKWNATVAASSGGGWSRIDRIQSGDAIVLVNSTGYSAVGMMEAMQAGEEVSLRILRATTLRPEEFSKTPRRIEQVCTPLRPWLMSAFSRLAEYQLHRKGGSAPDARTYAIEVFKQWLRKAICATSPVHRMVLYHLPKEVDGIAALAITKNGCFRACAEIPYCRTTSLEDPDEYGRVVSQGSLVRAFAMTNPRWLRIHLHEELEVEQLIGFCSELRAAGQLFPQTNSHSFLQTLSMVEKDLRHHLADAATEVARGFSHSAETFHHLADAATEVGEDSSEASTVRRGDSSEPSTVNELCGTHL